MPETHVEPYETALGTRVDTPAGGVTVGDEVLVDRPYTGLRDLVWCEVVHIAVGTAAVFPVRYRARNGATGRAGLSEVYDVRRPARLAEIAAMIAGGGTPAGDDPDAPLRGRA